jgi:hypothetical protein
MRIFGSCICLACTVYVCLLYFMCILLHVFVVPYVYLLYYVCIPALTLDAGLLARSQYPEGPGTGHIDTGFPWFPCVYKRILRQFPSSQVAITCLPCSPPDLNSLFIFFFLSFHICVYVNNHCHRVITQLQLINIITIKLNLMGYADSKFETKKSACHIFLSHVKIRSLTAKFLFNFVSLFWSSNKFCRLCLDNITF